ncbi:MAG: hypothetical protein QOG83_634 [Alphaproteobacteria bacterium]|jgi:hypothetical protein|nr:hypothetical protein [Alphaproteobacteria bacterium]
MFHHRSIHAAALALGLLLTTVGAQAFDDAQYPDLRGAWNRTPPGNPRFDPTKPRGLEQQAPLTPEFQARYEASLADQNIGGQGDALGYTCMAWGMPAMMNLYDAMEVIVTPETTYMMVDDVTDSVRRIFTDGRDFPDDFEPTYNGYSIGKWLDTDGDGRYDLLEVETRLFKGPRGYDNTGLMLHPDNKSVIKERIYLSKGDPNVLVEEITVIDNALTRPWTAIKNYKRESTQQPFWREAGCPETNHVRIGNENYFLSAEGYLMPAKKDQAPPDLRHFNQANK